MNSQELIEKYVNGEMSDAERKAFEDNLTDDTKLANELLSYQKSRLAIKAAIRQEIREDTGKALQDWKNKKKRRTRRIYRWSIAATILLITAIGISFFIGNKQTVSPDQLFAAHFELPKVSNIRTNSSDHPIFEQAVTAFYEKSFTTVLDLLSPQATDPDISLSSDALIMLGVSHLALNNLSQAINVLQKVDSSGSLYQDAEWYLALAYLKNGQTNEAKQILGKIAQTPRHFKRQEAKEIEKQLD